MSDDLTLRKLKNTSFPALYSEFIQNNITDNGLLSILSIAIVLINTKDESLQRLGYHIIVEHCNRTQYYFPLYELAINYGLYPISSFIEHHYVSDDEKNFYTYWNDAYTQHYRNNAIVFTNQQLSLYNFFSQNTNTNVSVVAPTSYGKSELIIDTINRFIDKKICILTSTKALLSQTKKRIKNSGITQKIIVHPEMYNSTDDSFIAVLTQERLLRLFKNNAALCFDCIIIDEAHEILDNSIRSQILASVIIVAKKRNPDVIFKFLTPFITDTSNLKPRFIEFDMSAYTINEFVKTEKYYIHDIKRTKKIYVYDQFMDYFLEEDDIGNISEEEEVLKYAARKNIIYFNKPTDIESFSKKLSSKLPDIDSPQIETAIQNISEYLDPAYNLLLCLKKGIIYHHASIPDTIRSYIEELYKNIPEIRFVITSSTLLSGVNLPAERMFILDNKKGQSCLRPEEFKNLIGRICRFSEIFNPDYGSMSLLEPQIHLIFGQYFSSNADYKRFIQKVAKVDQTIKDSVDNVLLSNTHIAGEKQHELKNVSELLENYENGVINEYNERYITTAAGKACIMNGIREIDIFTHEVEIQDKINQYVDNNKIDNTDDLLNIIHDCFIRFLSDNKRYDDIRRLNNIEARRFYAMMIDWRAANKSYAEMISLFLSYWQNLQKDNPTAYIYAGRWGNVDIGNSFTKPYIYINSLDTISAPNLAIVRIKEEQDFIDNILIKYIETLHDLDIIDPTFYLNVKYGTDNPEVICLLKNGLSLSLSMLIIDKYRPYIEINIDSSTFSIHRDLIETMQLANENQILIYELQSNI